MTASMKFFSKMLDSKTILAFQKYGISEQCFITSSEIGTYKAIVKFIKKNNSLPSPEELSIQVDGFLYVPNVVSSFDVLAAEIKSEQAKHEILRVIQGQVMPDDPHKRQESIVDKINKLPGNESLDWLIDQLAEIKKKTIVQEKVGFSLTKDYEWFFTDYDDRENGKSAKVWASKFPAINKVSGGGYMAGNTYCWYGRSGRGKSIFCLEEAVEAASKGARVLYWSLEMSKYEIFCRAYTSSSAKLGLFNKEIDDAYFEAGFPAKEILMAQLSKEYKQALKAFAETLNQTLDGEIIFRTIDEQNFDTKTVKQLESEIEHLNADVVVIDPIYLMHMERNTTGTKGGGLAETSKAIKHLAGRTNTVIHLVTQAAETKDQYQDDQRVLKAPSRDEMKKSSQLLEDASLTMGIDSLDGNGIIKLGKGRFGGEDITIDTIFLPNVGIVRELPSPKEANEQFKKSSDLPF